MSKGIATQTILLMLVGIIVVGILIYIVYRTVMNPSLSLQECEARLISWCMNCKNTNFANSGDYISVDLFNSCDTVLENNGIYIHEGAGVRRACTQMKADCQRVGIE